MDDAQKVKDAISIVEYIGRYITLKKAGRNFTGLCPFHGEKSPSFNVSPERNIFKCFGCGLSGDIITFVMQREGLDFSEALKLLANEAGITLTHTVHSNHDQTDRLYAVLESCAKLYHHLLLHHPSAQAARNYLTKRGFDLAGQGREVVEHFQLGFAPDSWRTALSALQSKGFNQTELLAAGIITQKNGRTYDMFRNRIIYPLYNRIGRIVGFSGRVLDDSKPKYLNTSETDIFHKREFLYGFYQARDAIRKNDSIVVVEGEMDMLSSYRIGVQNVSAVKGSSLTPEHIKNIKHLTSNIKLCFDADFAGNNAQTKAIQDAIDVGCNVQIITLPEGKDADECIRHNPNDWQTAVQKAKPFYDFLIESAVHRHDPNTAQGKSAILSDLHPFFTTIFDPVIQSHYLSKLAHTLSLPENDIKNILNNKHIAANAKINNNDKETKQDIDQPNHLKINNLSPTPEHYFLALLIQTPKSTPEVVKILPSTALHDTTLRILYNAIAQYQSVREEQPLQALLARTLQEANLSTSVLDVVYSLPTPEEIELLQRELRVSSLHLARQWVHKALQQVAHQLQKSQALGETTQLDKLQSTLLKLTIHRQLLEKYSQTHA